jgi:tRNA A37 threonylcarbamoyladenosine modification protein TsaB
MIMNNSIILDFSFDQKYIFLIINNKYYEKKILSLKRSEDLSNIFFEFIKKKKIKLDNVFHLYLNVGPGNLIAIRNSIVFAKTLSLLIGCSINGYSNYELLKNFKKINNEVLLFISGKNILLNMSKKKVKKLETNDVSKFQFLKTKIKYNKKILEKLILSKKFEKKVFPISYSDI